MMATSRMRGLKKREERVLPEGTFCWGKFTYTRELFISGIYHCMRHGKTAHRTLPIFTSCKSVSFQSRRQIGKDYRVIHSRGSLREVSQELLSLTEQIRVMTVPNTGRRGEKRKQLSALEGSAVQNQTRLFVWRQEIINAFQAELIHAANDGRARTTLD